MSERKIIDEFDLYGEILNYGNRTDVEGYSDEDFYSWEADETDFKPDWGHGPMDAAIVRLYNDYDDEVKERKFLVAWQEIFE